MDCCNKLHTLCCFDEKDLLCMLAKKVELMIKEMSFISKDNKDEVDTLNIRLESIIEHISKIKDQMKTDMSSFKHSEMHRL